MQTNYHTDSSKSNSKASLLINAFFPELHIAIERVNILVAQEKKSTYVWKENNAVLSNSQNTI